MFKFVVVTDPDTVSGYRLAGVEVHDGGQPLYPYYFGLE